MQFLFSGRCLTNSSIFIDCRDDKKQKRFLGFGVDLHFTKVPSRLEWYFNEMFYDVPQGLGCCSDVPVQFHWVKNIKEIVLLEYLIYHFRVFGLDKNQNDFLPRKFTLDEILAASNVQSNSSEWTKFVKKHTFFHNMDKDEFYK